MNEQFQELAGQALDLAVSYTWTTLNYEQIQELLACHAALVVKACIAELEISKRCDIFTGQMFICEYNDCIDDQITMLKEHFDVE